MIGVSARGNKRFVQISVIAGADNRRFADSALKGDGFELLVPPRRNSPWARHVVSAQSSTSSERH